MVVATTRVSARLRCAAAFAGLLLACAAYADGPGEAFAVAGQCRDGQPQGGYALRAADGRLRVQGAFSQGHRVGSFIFWSSSGVRVAHLPFDADALSGTVSLWYARPGRDAEPPRKLEAGYRQGVRHGQTRSWYADGRRRAELDFADGVLTSARAWSDAGVALDEAEARALAERDQAADAEYLDSLLAIVRRHLPDCAPPAPGVRASIDSSLHRTAHATG